MNAIQQQRQRTANERVDDLTLVVEAMDQQLSALADAMKAADLLCVTAIQQETTLRQQELAGIVVKIGTLERTQIVLRADWLELDRRLDTFRAMTLWQRWCWLVMGL